MENHYRLTITPNRMSAKIELIEKLEEGFTFTYDEVMEFLNKKNVTFGIYEKLFKSFCDHPSTMDYPIVIAEGIQPHDGKDAYLVNEIKRNKNEKREKFNFRNVIEIPSVNSGQILASIIPQTPGSSGKDVTGKEIPAKDGKPIDVQPGTNVILHGSQYYSTADGQVSLTNKKLSVNTVFEVNGDLDLKTGNINFIGNIVIHGNVPSGYELKAGGDIKIFGLVEGANLHSEGNILISGGVSGGHKGSITAGGNIQASYLNQANVQAKQDIFIEKSILNSDVRAGGSIHSKSALVIGGNLTAGVDMHIKEVGNKLFTKTNIFVGEGMSIGERENQLLNEKKELQDNFQKLMNIEQKILQREKLTGALTEDQKIIILKQKTTKNFTLKKLKEIDDELISLKSESNEKRDSSIFVYENIYPNTTIQFGKYAIKVQKKLANTRYYFSNGEIVSDLIQS